MGQIMQMIPGMSQLLPQGNVQMTESRRTRVAKGSGSSLAEVSLLLEEYKRMEKMVGKMGKSGLFGKGGDMTQLTRNPGQVMQKMQSAMDPRMLQQMGGAQNMMKMKNMGGMMDGMGGMDPDMMKNMQKMMGGAGGG